MTDDGLGRPLQDLRISVTDRCNFRCDYCMPVEKYGHNHDFLPKSEILSFEEIAIIVESMLKLGLKKVRITGGEPLLRKDICGLISMIRNLDQDLDIAMTTNGTLLGKYANKLFDAGLNRVTVSLDAIESELFKELSNSNKTPQHIGFKENRHEQSITSILRKKMGSVVIDGDESFMQPFGEGYSLKYPFWAKRSRN